MHFLCQLLSREAARRRGSKTHAKTQANSIIGARSRSNGSASTLSDTKKPSMSLDLKKSDAQPRMKGARA